MSSFALMLLLAINFLLIAGWVHVENQAYHYPAVTTKIYLAHLRYLPEAGPTWMWVGFVAILTTLCLLPVSPLWYCLALPGLPFAYMAGRELALKTFGAPNSTPTQDSLKP